MMGAPVAFIDLQAQYRRLKPQIDARMHAVLDHGQFILGPEVAEFERALGEYTGGAHVVGVSNGTDALMMALMAHGIGPGDAVYVPSFTFTATAEAVLMLGATPVFVDVLEDTCNLDVEDLKRAIVQTQGLRPKAVIAVDLFGLPADYGRICDVAAAHDMQVIADAAQSLSGAIDGVRVGKLAPLTATSFFPAKPLGCFGDGGALFTSDPEMAEKLRSIRGHGTGKAKYDIIRIGMNARLDTLQAAILLVKLTVLEEERNNREKLSLYYDSRLSNVISALARPAGYQSAWAQYTIKLEHRDHVQAALSQSGIPTQIYYPRPMHLQPAYAAYGGGEGALPVSENLSRRVLSLPMHPYMPEEVAARICDAVCAAVGAGERP
ncbi:MAG: DegT/DnrJ/EryC1/StrS family aminotransferase [Alphaproteobacteria bacterium]|nr:DegT/DnrJ/EryC1/StrS family aminotransferase [Alphaproteobacteria bacterium]